MMIGSKENFLKEILKVIFSCKKILFLFVLGVFLLVGFNASAADDSPMAKGATYVGVETCTACHDDVGQRFKLTSHYKGVMEEEGVLGGGCEACHGPGSLHAESTEKKDIVRYSPENCFTCHMGKRAEFQLQHHHPVVEGKMTCTDCHNPHETEAESLASVTSLQKSDQACFKCHKEMKGPYVFEHDAMREGCQTCHNPHGSTYDRMLIADQTNLCLRCHWEPAFNTSTGGLGGVSHGAHAGAGGEYNIGRGAECIDHHRAPHGSNIWKTLNR